NHINKNAFKVPFVCGARNLGEALRRLNEGAAMIRSKGEAGTGNIIEAVRHIRAINEEIESLKTLKNLTALKKIAKEMRVPVELVQQVKKLGRLPVVNFAAGGIATPADAALVMQLGVDGVFVGSGIFKSNNPAKRAKAIVEAVTNFRDADILAKVSENIGEPMTGIEIDKLTVKMAGR
ncbi:MAG: pyridoxal 5'-phosphate synthase lyase subunit PdxS, partial [Patescibacteria group bacterium]